MSSHISYLGEAKRPRGRLFGISQADRKLHAVILGKTGVGKSSLLAGLIMQDIAVGRGCALIDPHGDLAAGVHDTMARSTDRRLIYLNAADPTCPFGINPLRQMPEDEVARATSNFMEVLERQWPSAWGVRMEHVLRNTLHVLIGRPRSSLPDVLRLYRDDNFRAGAIATTRSEIVRAFWEHEFEPLTPRQRSDMVAPIENKMGALLTDPVLYRVLVRPQRQLDLRAIMDGQQTLLVNLARGRIGADSAALLGSVLVSLLGATAFSRTDVDLAERHPFYLYVDEFQVFATRAFAEMVSELRKTGVALVLATQHLSGVQMDIRQAVLGNVGNMIAFRVGVDDASLLARQFGSRIRELDLMNLPHREFYAKLAVDGAPLPPVSGRTLDYQSPDPSRDRLYA